MGRKSVAVLDIRSTELAIIIGERGVNNTYVLKACVTESYSGYNEREFYNPEEMAEKIYRLITAAEQMSGEHIKELYVGVPGIFCEVEPKEQAIGFPKRRRIGQREMDALFTSGIAVKEGYEFIRATSMIFITADNRRVVDPTGLCSNVLRGELSYFYCRNYFTALMEDIFTGMKIGLHYLPAQYAMASYLIPSETRDEYALFLDVGIVSSTILVLLGNGVKAQKTFMVGEVQLAALLMNEFKLSYDASCALLAKANLFAKSDAGIKDFVFDNESYEIDRDKLVGLVRDGLDGLCEVFGEYLEGFTGKDFDCKPVFVTGEGLVEIRGAFEHIGKRLSRVCEQLAPDLPYYNKPSMSSRIALLDMAYEDHRKGGILNRILDGLGG